MNRFLISVHTITSSARSRLRCCASSGVGTTSARYRAILLLVTRAHVPTPVILKERLKGVAGSKDRFGSTAAEVLVTADLIAAANADWDKSTLADFLDQQKIHQKVWGKLVSISRRKNLRSLPLDQLPASYTALYALEVMSPQELAAALKEDVVRARASSRSILDWTKAFRLRGTGIEQEIPLTLVLTEDLTPEQRQNLLSALEKTAAEFGAQILEGKGGVRQADLKADQRKARALEIEEELMQEIGTVVTSAPEDLKTKFAISSASDLIEGTRATFTGFFQVLVGKADGVFWADYGRAYCLKIAREFNLTESRAERYQLKKRVTDAIEWWGPKIDGFEAMADQVLKTYMSR